MVNASLYAATITTQVLQLCVFLQPRVGGRGIVTRAPTLRQHTMTTMTTIPPQLFGHAASAGIHEKINILRVKNRFANPVSCLTVNEISL